MRKPVMAGNGTRRFGTTPTPYKCAGGCGARVVKPFDRCQGCAATADPTGLGGERVARLSANDPAPAVELWRYPPSRDFEAIADAWFMHGGKATLKKVTETEQLVRVERSL